MRYRCSAAAKHLGAGHWVPKNNTYEPDQGCQAPTPVVVVVVVVSPAGLLPRQPPHSRASILQPPFLLRTIPIDLPGVLLIGLDGAGKSSLFYRLKINVVLTTQPTSGYNVHVFSPLKG